MLKSGKLLKIDEKDDVAVALENIAAGEVLRIGGFELIAKQDIESGHKIANRDIKKGENIIKYGFPIGRASRDIAEGEHIHSHNISTNLKGLKAYTYTPATNPICRAEPEQFMAYLRKDGRIGIRNEIWIVNTVGCVNTTAQKLAKEANKRFAGRTDGIFAYPHPYGCSQLGDDHRTTQRILAGLVNHPNAGGVLVLGLGCENNNIDAFKPVLGEYDSRRVRFLACQDTEDEIETGLKLLDELSRLAQATTRQSCPTSKLVVGLKCGGSDAFSGITANPLIGTFTDMLVARGGTGVLTEVPEMFGAETILMNRCIDRDVFDNTVRLINEFKIYYMSYNMEIYENPSPGNKKGGISTLEEKSLGCTQKGGNQSIVGVLDYGESVTKPGLNLLKGPGNDTVACTALTAAGAHLILFSTGRGTPLGAPVPTVKISSNTQLYKHKKNWIDFDAGQLLTGESIEDIKQAFFDFVIKTASGEIKTKNECNGYREIGIFKDGVTL